MILTLHKYETFVLSDRTSGVEEWEEEDSQGTLFKGMNSYDYCDLFTIF